MINEEREIEEASIMDERRRSSNTEGLSGF